MKNTFLIIIILNFSFYGQSNGKLFDSITGKPIEYANIWIEGENIGATSQKDGSFIINTSSSNKIKISAIGYKSKKININSFENILLVPIIYTLSEVEIFKRKNLNKISFGKVNNSEINIYYGTTFNTPSLLASLIKPNSKILKHPYFKQITINTDSKIDKSLIKLIFLEVNVDGSPGSNINDDKIIIEVKEGRRLTKIDLFDYKIKIPINGVFIAFEWLIIEQNKYVYPMLKFNLNDKISDKLYTTYCPSIGLVTSDENLDWFMIGDIWQKRKLHKKSDNYIGSDRYENKFSNIALKIEMTD